MPLARRLSQTLGVYGLVVQGRQSELGSQRFRNAILLCKARLLTSKSCSITALPVTVGAGRPSRFAGGQRTVFALPSVSDEGRRRAAEPGCMPREQDRWLRPCRSGRSGSVSRHFTLLPVSQRLKPQCSVVQMHSNTEPSTALAKLARGAALASGHGRLGIRGKEAGGPAAA